MNMDRHDVDLAKIRDLVDRAVKAAVPADQMYERKFRPESAFGWPEPQPLAGLKAALTVASIATDRAHKFAKALRGEGSTWEKIADLLEIPWSEEYVRRERAYELVGGPGQGAYGERRVYWTCGGPGGCGEYITDRGPYDGFPGDCEDGHLPTCQRHAAEIAAYRREQEAREERDRVMDEAMAQVTDPFGRETVERARYVQSHGGRYLGWSTSETLAVALVLNDQAGLEREGYSTREAAMRRVWPQSSTNPSKYAGVLRTLRAAATGLTTEQEGDQR